MKSTIKKLSKRISDRILSKCFSNADEIARETKLVQRESRLSGAVFIKTLVLGFLKNPTASLNDLAQQCSTYKVKITSQGLHDRINHYAVDFMKAMFQEILERLQSDIALPLPIVQQFVAVNIVDSTIQALPESMTKGFPGAGGNGSNASMKVQLVFEFLRGNLTQLVIQAGRKADQAYKQYLEVIQAGSLTIADLGYFCLSSLQAIVEKQAYFLTRFLISTALFYPGGERLDLFNVLPSENEEPLDLQVEMGVKQRIRCRLIAVHVPPGAAEERRRKANRRQLSKGKKYTKKYLSFLNWSVFVTNVPDTMLSARQVIAFYRIRWQIELIFKFWKSLCGFKKISAVRPERILTELYAKLLIAVLANYLTAPFRIPEEAWDHREVSPKRVRNILSDKANKLMKAIDSPARLRCFISSFLKRVLCHGLKQRRRKDPHLLALLSTESLPSASP